MSCKSALYAANTNDQILAVGNVVNFGTIVRRFGCNCNLSGGNVILNGSGYYDIDANFTVVGTAAGDVTITLFRDGSPITGANVTKTIVAGSTYNMSIPAIVRETCCCESTITAQISGVDATISNAAITVEKI